jgi:predicted kinase
MRKWIRDRAKRRKPTENTSESTGKIGQQIDPSKPAPLMPSYDAEPAAEDEQPEPEEAPRQQSPERQEAPRRQPHERPATSGRRGRGQRQSREVEEKRDEPQAEGRMEVETQPDSPSTPSDVGDITNKPAPGKREPRGVVVLAIGLPGSGKTTWFKRRGVTPLSSDMLRSILFDSITEQRYQGLVFSTLRSLLRARLIAKMPWNYVDATNLSPHERRQWIKMARGFGFEVQAVFFDVPVELCIQRNSKRERQVPEDVMRQMAAKLKPPTFKEGFSKIVVVRVKDSAG